MSHNLQHGKLLFSSGQSPLKKLLNRFTKPARDLLYGNIQYGEYKKRQPAIKAAHAKDEESYAFQTNIKATTKSNIGFSPDDKKPLEYKYPGGWQDPRMGVTAVGNKDRLNRSSSSIAGSNLTGGKIQDTYVQDGNNWQGYHKSTTPTEHGDIEFSQLNLTGKGNASVYQKYPEGFAGLPAHEGTYTSKKTFGIRHLSADAPEDLSFRDLMKMQNK
jgi:hypothetical protein